MSHRHASLLTAAAALAALAFAYFTQYVLQLSPCPLCLWERWPYRAVVVLGLLASLCRPRTTSWILGLAGVVMAVNVLIAGLHVGVEQGLWPSPLPECNGILVPGALLPAHPAIPCDRPVYLLPAVPLSFATLDFCASALFALVLLSYSCRKQRRFR